MVITGRTTKMQNGTPIEYLLSLADYCDKNGYDRIADKIDGLINDNSFVKVAQYVSSIGFVLRQERCFQNCIRRHRVTSDAPMQEIVFDCLKEYQDGQKYNDEEWGKYASTDMQQDMQQYVHEWLKTSVKNRVPLRIATNSLISSISTMNDIQSDIVKVANTWSEIEKSPIGKNEIFKDFEAIAKQAGILGDIGSGIGKAVNWLGRGVGKAVNWGAYQKRYADIIKAQAQTVQEILQAVNTFNQFINGVIQSIPASGAKDMLAKAVQKGDLNGVRNAISTVITAVQRSSSASAQGSAAPPMAAAASLNKQYRYVFAQQSPYQELEDQRSGAPAAAPAAVPTPPAPAATPAAQTPKSPGFGQINGKQIAQQLQTAMGHLNQIQPLVEALFTNMKDLSKEPRVMQAAATEITAVNQGINTISRNPLNTKSVMALNASISALDQKLRNSIFNQQQPQPNQSGQQNAGAPTGQEAAQDQPEQPDDTIPLTPEKQPGTQNFQQVLQQIQPIITQLDNNGLQQLKQMIDSMLSTAAPAAVPAATAV